MSDSLELGIERPDDLNMIEGRVKTALTLAGWNWMDDETIYIRIEVPPYDNKKTQTQKDIVTNKIYTEDKVTGEKIDTGKVDYQIVDVVINTSQKLGWGFWDDGYITSCDLMSPWHFAGIGVGDQICMWRKITNKDILTDRVDKISW